MKIKGYCPRVEGEIIKSNIIDMRTNEVLYKKGLFKVISCHVSSSAYLKRIKVFELDLKRIKND